MRISTERTPYAFHQIHKSGIRPIKKVYSLAEVSAHNDRKDCCLVVDSLHKKCIVRHWERFTSRSLEVSKSKAALEKLESLHKVVDLYVWLSFVTGGIIPPDHELASTQK